MQTDMHLIGNVSCTAEEKCVLLTNVRILA